MSDIKDNLLVNLPRDLEGFLQRYVYVIDGDRVCDLALPPHAGMMLKKEFSGMTAGIMLESVVSDGRSKTGKLQKESAASSVWLRDPARMIARGEAYVPGGERLTDGGDGLEYINTFAFPPHEKGNPKKAKRFFDHLRYLIPQKERFDLFCDFLAHILQYPQDRPKFVPLLIARHHGTGRGYVVDMLNAALGDWNCSAMDIQDLSEGAYQDGMHRKLFTAFHEVKVSDGRYTVDDKVRSKITEERLPLNLKYGKKLPNEKVYSRFLWMSQHPDAVILPKHDRRVWVHETLAEPRDPDYYDEIYTHMDEDAPHIFAALMARDISQFNAGMRAPMTPEKKAMQSFAQSDTDQTIEDMVDHYMPKGLDVMTFRQVIDAADKLDGAWMMQSNENAIKHILQENHELYDPGNKTGKVKWRGMPVRVWIMRNPDKWRGADAFLIRDQLDEAEKWSSTVKNPKEEALAALSVVK